MTPSSRRTFLSHVGQGMLVAGVGYGAAMEMGLCRAIAAEAGNAPDPRITFGKLEPLVALMQATPVDQMLAKVVVLLQKGTTLHDLTAAAALANARAFGGDDYIGFHTLMALEPAYTMAHRLPTDRAALPVLKVLYRNTANIQQKGGENAEALKPVDPAASSAEADRAAALRKLVHARDRDGAERLLAAIAQHSAEDAYNDLLVTVHDSPEVHRVVLAHRVWDMLKLVGKENANTMLRQSLRYCIRNEEWSAKHLAEPREMLPKVLDQFKLLSITLGNRKVDDAWVDRMSRTIFESTAVQAAEAVAGALAEGISPDAVSEAIGLAANQLVLRDAGRREREIQPNKPLGSVHGDSIGVHACDSAHAWRQIAKVSNHRNSIASLILAGWQVAYDRVSRGGEFLDWKPRPYQENLEKIKATDAPGLIAELNEAIRHNDQAQASAVAHRYGSLNHDPDAIFNVLLGYATSEDGALHAEKFYRTTTEEFAAARPAFRWRQVVALARVTASEFGTRAPGYDQACELLNVRV